VNSSIKQAENLAKVVRIQEELEDAPEVYFHAFF
jgi:hypothetical protein